MDEVSTPIEDILSYLRGGKPIEIQNIARTSSEALARAIMYVLNDKSYHRENLCYAILSLITYAPQSYRQIAWAIIQRVPLSHLVHIMDVISKKENTRRLRHAIVTKIATSSEDEIIRAYFMMPGAFRKMFSYLYLPRDKINYKEITNPSYKLAYKLSTLSATKAMQELNIRPVDLVRKYRIPLHLVMQYVQTVDEAEELAQYSSPDDFIRHARWFRSILGDERFEKIAMRKIDRVKDPFSFLSIRDHLESTGALTPKLLEYMERRAEDVLDQLSRQYNLSSVALIVDVSGSMYEAIKITAKLYDVFEKMNIVSRVIAFNDTAFEVDRSRLTELIPEGMTSIGSAIILLAQKLKNTKEIPQAIILVSDLEENTPPYLNDTLQLLEDYGNIPLIVLHCGSRAKLKINYPHAIIPVDSFHPRLVKEIIANIVRLTSKIVEEKKITEIVKERRPIEEEIGMIELPRRPEESLRPGFLEKLLCYS